MWKCKAKAFKEDETIMCDWAKYYQENVQVATTEDQLLTDNMPAIHSKASLEKWTLSHCRNMWHVTQKTTAPLKGWQQTVTAPEKSSTSIMGKCHFLSVYNTHIDSDIDMMLQKGKINITENDYTAMHTRIFEFLRQVALLSYWAQSERRRTVCNG